TAVHAGNIGASGDWRVLTEAAALARPRAEIVFVGDGMHASEIRTAGVRVVPPRPKQQVPSVMAAGHLQLVTQRPGTEGLVVPSKLFTALAHGRPVLAVVPAETDVAQIVTRYQCGIV